MASHHERTTTGERPMSDGGTAAAPIAEELSRATIEEEVLP